ncbi:MAG: DUF720 domain-containing protein [Chlamydiales bacterium]
MTQLSSITASDSNNNMKTVETGTTNKLSPEQKKAALYMYLWNLLLEMMDNSNKYILNKSTILSNNAEAQTKLNEKDGQLQFVVLANPDNATQADIERVQNLNAQLSSVKDNIRSSLLTMRQSAQLMMTDTSTHVNFMQQNATQDSEWLKILNKIFSVINEMNQPQ